MEENKIIINKSEYDELKINAMKYSMLLEILIDEAKINDSWRRNEAPLKFNDEKLNMVLNLIEKKDYEEKLTELSKEGNENE